MGLLLGRSWVCAQAGNCINLLRSAVPRLLIERSTTIDPRPLLLGRIPQGKKVSRALAVKINDECLYRWGERCYDEFLPGEREKSSPEEFRDYLQDHHLHTMHYMAWKLYCEFPNLPRLDRSAILIMCPKSTWLYVFKDNSSPEAFHAPLSQEDVTAAKEFLGVKEQGAMWYDVTRRI
ncbi:hypothetical protein C8Q80DRAFT_330226 [Daedaleopsis nitida]|nr:hypothetical protein C8Q80DRAFT_330226 [Daedaleopsis nitida]